MLATFHPVTVNRPTESVKMTYQEHVPTSAVKAVDAEQTEQKDVNYIKVHKKSLHIDTSYQRSECISKKLVGQIKESFDPSLFLPLTVARRPSGELYIVDGQHRWLGVLDNPLVTYVKAVVIPVTSIEQEAGLFIKLNTRRTGVSTFSRFKASVRAQLQPEMEIDRFLRFIGLPPVPTNKSYGIRCFSEVIDCWRTDKELAKEVLKQIKEVVEMSNEQVNVRFLRPLFALAKLTDGASLDSKWTHKMQKIGQTKIVASIASQTDWKNRAAGAGVLAGMLNETVRRKADKLSIDKILRAQYSGDDIIRHEDDNEE